MLNPILIPVKLPGPLTTIILSKSLISRLFSSNIDAIIGIVYTECEYSLSFVFMYKLSFVFNAIVINSSCVSINNIILSLFSVFLIRVYYIKKRRVFLLFIFISLLFCFFWSFFFKFIFFFFFFYFIWKFFFSFNFYITICFNYIFYFFFC